jgi:hypothetical protein
MKNSNCFSYIFEVAWQNRNVSDIAQPTATPKVDSSRRIPEAIITSTREMMNEKFQTLNIHCRYRSAQWKYDRRCATSDIIFLLKSRTCGGRWPSLTATGDFRCSNASCDVDHTSIVSGDLENVRLTFEIFLLSLVIPDLLLLPVDCGHI